MKEHRPHLYVINGSQMHSVEPVNYNVQKDRNFNGAAIVDANGAEIPITEDMVNSVLMQAQDFLIPSLSDKTGT